MLRFTSNFICPLCGINLELDENSFKCKNNHSYDRAKSGYVNLLMSQKLKEKRHGDDRLMIRARSMFLEEGYYNLLLNKILELVVKYVKDKDVILDAGCGECWYTNNLNNYLKKSFIDVIMLGIDISKSAIDIATRRNKNIELAVASICDIPVNDDTCNIVLSIFAPYNENEFKRILKKDGIFVKVIPLEYHLWSFKKTIYDNAYMNVVDSYEINGYKLLEKCKISDKIHLKSNNDIMNLFLMTPYYYKTGKEDQKKLEGIDELDTEIEFEIRVYQSANNP